MSGRPKMKKVPMSQEIFHEARCKRQLSINKLTDDKSKHYVGVSRKTITRALNDGVINPDILEKIGEQLNVDPHWLTGEDLRIMPWIKRNPEYCRIENHPYDKNAQQRKSINFTQHFHELLLLHSISTDQFHLLPEEIQHGFEMELDLVIKMVISKYFSTLAKSDDIFLSNKDLHEMSCQVLSGETYDKLFDLIEA